MTDSLTDKQQKLFSLFKIAIEEERKAQKLYAEVLQYTEEISLRKIIESLLRKRRNMKKCFLESIVS